MWGLAVELGLWIGIRTRRPKYSRYIGRPNRPCNSHRCCSSAVAAVGRRPVVAVAGSTVEEVAAGSSRPVEVEGLAGSIPVVVVVVGGNSYFFLGCRSSLGFEEEHQKEIGRTLE